MAVNQRITNMTMQVLGSQSHAARSEWGPWTHGHVRSVADRIDGGSSEIQRNVIATPGLGLPRG